MQQFLIKPNYHYAKAYAEFTQTLIFEDLKDFNTQVLALLQFRCETVHAGKMHNESISKEWMSGFAIASTHSSSKWNSVTKDNFIDTGILVLDVDEVPSTVSNVSEWLESLLPKNVKCLWYSTPRYTPAKKRIRAVIPLTRTISMDEKADMAHRIIIQGMDKASFEAAKFSLLPCYCKESSIFEWGIIGSRFLDPDKDLPAYSRPPKVFESTPHYRYTSRAAGIIPLVSLIEAINNAPDGHSQEVIKPGLSRLLRLYPLTLEDLESQAHLIDREDRRRDYLGIGSWILRQNSR